MTEQIVPVFREFDRAVASVPPTEDNRKLIMGLLLIRAARIHVGLSTGMKASGEDVVAMGTAALELWGRTISDAGDSAKAG